MKLKRLKHARKVMGFYKNNFDFAPPIRVLIDGTFCKAALKFKINISEQLPKYLDCEVKQCTTQCVLAECEALGPLLYGPFKVLQQFHIQSCSHDTPIPASKCLLSMIKQQNKAKFYIATQDQELAERLRSRPGNPLLFIAYNAINLEAPAETSRKRAHKKVQSNMVPTDFHKEILDKMKTDVLGPATHVNKHRHKKVKGPNPLSCKKKKSKTGTGKSSIPTETKKVGRRKKKKPVQDKL
ncbi:rRNA-processing protein UTP23 homolog [Liolophura sinensis]|uniref:rRNA-processing protein UTP23 homolog n=1 Tax=Liolophura sinensis TaxID=3198878 RepID=UPI0031595F60